MLLKECAAAGVEDSHRLQCDAAFIKTIRFRLATNTGEFDCQSLVIATGGLSIPKIGATDFGYRIARQFGLAIVRPARRLSR